MTSRADQSSIFPDLANVLPAGVGIVSIERRPSEYRTSFSLEEVDLTLDNGEQLQLVAKNVGRSALTEAARSAKPEFLGNPRREIAVYRELLNPLSLGAPQFFGASIDEDSDRYWLFIERIAGVGLYQIGNIDQWKQVAAWLARFHACLASNDAIGAARCACPLIEYSEQHYRTWRDRAVAFSSSWPSDARNRMTWLADRYDPVIDRLATLPRTVIHGEFYASNILLETRGDGIRVAPVDWEMAAIGPGLIDLAAMTAGSWSATDRRAFAAAYSNALAMPVAIDALLTDLTYCRLHLAMQWLGWSASWTPPREHAHDWLSEAIDLADELRL